MYLIARITISYWFLSNGNSFWGTIKDSKKISNKTFAFIFALPEKKKKIFCSFIPRGQWAFFFLFFINKTVLIGVLKCIHNNQVTAKNNCYLSHSYKKKIKLNSLYIHECWFKKKNKKRFLIVSHCLINFI